MFFLLAPLGILGARLVFAHLAIVAVALTLLRARMKESVLWEDAAAKRLSDPGAEQASVSSPFAPRHLKSVLFLVGMYGIWNLWAGTNGFFFPHILRTVGSQSQAASVAMQAAGFFVAMLSIGAVFMRYSDKVNQRLLFGVAAVIQITGMALLALFPLTTPIALAYLTWSGSVRDSVLSRSASSGGRSCSRR